MIIGMLRFFFAIFIHITDEVRVADRRAAARETADELRATNTQRKFFSHPQERVSSRARNPLRKESTSRSLSFILLLLRSRSCSRLRLLNLMHPFGLRTSRVSHKLVSLVCNFVL